jgi:glycosyl transferase family 25
MRVYVINLKDSIDRRESIERQLQQLKIEHKIIDAVNGRLLSDEEIRKKADMDEVEKYPEWLTNNVIATSLSHLSVYREICNSDDDWHLILEDDVILDANVKSVIHHIVGNGEIYKSRIVLLYALMYKGKIELSSNDFSKGEGFNIYKVLSKEEMGGAGAYIIHRDTASHFLEKNDKIKVAADSWHFFLQQGVCSQVDCVYPFAAKPGLFESTIGYVNKASLLYKIKHFIEKNKVPVFYALLRKKRKAIWERTSKVVIV